jgi:amino acid adenylation domain-containing protein
VRTGQRIWGPDHADLLLHQLVEAQADRVPDRRAVSLADQHLTYADLDTRANQLARSLIARGVREETLVAIVMERSLEAFVAILAVLKSGGAYVPIDPDYPAERIRLLIADADAALLITQSHVLPRLPAGDREILLIDEERTRLAALPAERVDRDGHADSLAYAIYTSGTTGAPKGVAISHRGVVNSTVARRDFYGDDPVRFLLLSSLAFDSSIAGIFWTFACGGCLIVPPLAVQQDPHRLAGHIAATGPTHLLCVPSLYQLIVRAAPADLADLRLCVLAGEEWPPDLHERHRRALPGARLANEYGATEVSVWSTGFVCPQGTLDGPPSVGTPIPAATMYILNDEFESASGTDKGEAYLGGVGVARGYLGRPAATAERFLPDPFGAEPGARMYRTGDFARWLPDGGAQFLGRIDEQAKIRGYRVELGEIRAHLTAQPEVDDAAVIVRNAATSSARIAGYVVLDRAVAAAPPLGELRRRLAERLPAHLVPDVLVSLPELPLTPNGKLDRDALPEPRIGTDGATPYLPPETDTERLLADVIADVLDLPRVGRADNFFELGCHSLHAMDIAARSRKGGIEVTAQQVLKCQTVAELARHATAGPATHAPKSPFGQVDAATMNRLLDRIR